MEKILVIDDEMHPGGGIDKKYGHLSESDLAVRIKNLFEGQEFHVDFVPTGEEGLKLIKKDGDKIKLVLLDVAFKCSGTRLQGPAIFQEIRKIRGELPIVIISQLPVRKITGQDDVFKHFVQLGASLFVEKKYFARRSTEQINFIEALARGKAFTYTMRYRDGLDTYSKLTLDIDLVRHEADKELSILKTPLRVCSPMSHYLQLCINRAPDPVHWTESDAVLDEWLDLRFHKEVHKLNEKVLRSSGGRVPYLLERLQRAGCRLNCSVSA